MPTYLCVKANNTTKKYELKVSANKPYMKVSTGYMALTTEIGTNTGLRVKVGGNSYRIVETYTTTISVNTSSTNTYSYNTSRSSQYQTTRQSQYQTYSYSQYSTTSSTVSQNNAVTFETIDRYKTLTLTFTRRLSYNLRGSYRQIGSTAIRKDVSMPYYANCSTLMDCGFDLSDFADLDGNASMSITLRNNNSDRAPCSVYGSISGRSQNVINNIITGYASNTTAVRMQAAAFSKANTFTVENIIQGETWVSDVIPHTVTMRVTKGTSTQKGGMSNSIGTTNYTTYGLTKLVADNCSGLTFSESSAYDYIQSVFVSTFSLKSSASYKFDKGGFAQAYTRKVRCSISGNLKHEQWQVGTSSITNKYNTQSRVDYTTTRASNYYTTRQSDYTTNNRTSTSYYTTESIITTQ